MAIELASKIFGSGLQTPRKAGGKGLQTPRKAGMGVGQGLQVSQKPFLWQPPPFYGTWEGQGKKGKGLLLGDNSPFNHIPHLGSNSLGVRDAKPKWKDIPLSNFDLLKWVKFMKIQNFKGIFSRDSKDHLHKTGSCIINLDDKIGNGTHWVATDIKGKNVFYFDSFFHASAD